MKKTTIILICAIAAFIVLCGVAPFVLLKKVDKSTDVTAEKTLLCLSEVNDTITVDVNDKLKIDYTPFASDGSYSNFSLSVNIIECDTIDEIKIITDRVLSPFVSVSMSDDDISYTIIKLENKDYSYSLDRAPQMTILAPRGTLSDISCDSWNANFMFENFEDADLTVSVTNKVEFRNCSFKYFFTD